jgi:hypothetical protein
MATQEELVRRFQARNRRRKPPRNRGQAYVSQGRAVENAANAANYSQDRTRSEREQSQQRMRRQLGYDKPGITVKGVRRKAKKAAKRIIPGY